MLTENNNNNNNNKRFIVPKAEYYSYLQVVKLINWLKGVLTSWDN